MKESQDYCALCGLPVEIQGFDLESEQGLQKFCCAGCQCMYQLINDQQQPKTNETLPLDAD